MRVVDNLAIIIIFSSLYHQDLCEETDAQLKCNYFGWRHNARLSVLLHYNIATDSDLTVFELREIAICFYIIIDKQCRRRI